jgi:type IV pilus assembly protein PilN
MIRVNLLKTSGTEKQKSRGFLPPEQRNAVMGLAMLVGSAMLVGGYWWYLGNERAGVQARIGEAEAELVQLQKASELVDQANARKAELTERLTLIDRLRASKRGPVMLLQTVSTSVTDGMWLLEIKQQGTSVQVDGRALSLTSVTDFTERLQNSGFFQRPVEILATSIEVVEETPVVRFSVRAEAVTPSVERTVVASAPRSTTPSASTTASAAGAPPSRPGA